MEEEGGGLRLSKRFSDQGGEVDLKTKAGTAWSHSFLNQKPWHPLSYPNQRRKWIAEQTHAQRQRRSEEVAREFAQEQEFFRQTALVSKKEKEKMEMMKAVSFMYVRPPGYNAESAKAAEMADERTKEEQSNPQLDPSVDGASSSMPLVEKKKPIPKDVFGRALPTEEQFEILKNAPRMETGVAGRVKPFGVEVRNVKCLRCGNYGHQSGDRECPLKDAIMPNEESRLKRDDPLTAMLAHTDSAEPLKWELKQKPGMSPPRGGFNPEDANQQIVAEEIFDEYGGFLSGENIPELLANFNSSKSKKNSTSKKKHKRLSSLTCTEFKDGKEDGSFNDVDRDKSKRYKNKKHERKKHKHSQSSSSDEAEFDRHDGSSDYDGNDERKRLKKSKHRRKKHKHSQSSSSDDAGFDRHDDDERKRSKKSKQKKMKGTHSDSRSSDNVEFDRYDDDGERKRKHRKKKHEHYNPNSSDDAEEFGRRYNNHNRRKHYGSSSSDDAEEFDRHRDKQSRHKHFDSRPQGDAEKLGRHHHKLSRNKHYDSRSSEDSEKFDWHLHKQSRHKYFDSRSSGDAVKFDRRHHKPNRNKHHDSRSLDDAEKFDGHSHKPSRHKHTYSSVSEDSGSDGQHRSRYRHHSSQRNHRDHHSNPSS